MALIRIPAAAAASGIMVQICVQLQPDAPLVPSIATIAAACTHCEALVLRAGICASTQSP